MLENGFDALLTVDKNLQHQQNFSKYTVTVIVLSAKINTYSVLTRLSAKVKEHLRSANLPPGPTIITEV